jgi:hypothetical protein
MPCTHTLPSLPYALFAVRLSKVPNGVLFGPFHALRTRIPRPVVSGIGRVLWRCLLCSICGPLLYLRVEVLHLLSTKLLVSPTDSTDSALLHVHSLALACTLARAPPPRGPASRAVSSEYPKPLEPSRPQGYVLMCTMCTRCECVCVCVCVCVCACVRACVLCVHARARACESTRRHPYARAPKVLHICSHDEFRV